MLFKQRSRNLVREILDIAYHVAFVLIFSLIAVGVVLRFVLGAETYYGSISKSLFVAVVSAFGAFAVSSIILATCFESSKDEHKS